MDRALSFTTLTENVSRTLRFATLLASALRGDADTVTEWFAIASRTPEGGQAMFSKLSDIQSGDELVRLVLVAICVTMLAPAAALAAVATALLMAPVALVAVPFMLCAFFGTANSEHQAAVVRRSLYPAALPALAH